MTKNYKLPKIGGDLQYAVLNNKPIVIVTDAETDDGRAIVEILKALSYIIGRDCIDAPINIAMVVGAGNPGVRLKIVEKLIEHMRQDGYLKPNMNITYIQGQAGDSSHKVYESMMASHISNDPHQENNTLDSFLKSNAKDGALFYGLKQPQELIQVAINYPKIVAKSVLYTYFGGFNYAITKPLKEGADGAEEILQKIEAEKNTISSMIASFESVKAFSNYIALQNEKSTNPRDITPKNTPEFSKVMLESKSNTIEFLKSMTFAWNCETIFKICDKKRLDEESQKIINADQKKLEDALESKNEEAIQKASNDIQGHKEALSSLAKKIDDIRGEDGKIDLSKFNVEFIQTLALDLKKLPPKFPIGMWANVTENPDSQSVIADDLGAFASFLDGFSVYGHKGGVSFAGGFIGVDEQTKGKLSCAIKVADHDIGALDTILAYFFSHNFPPKNPSSIPLPEDKEGDAEFFAQVAGDADVVDAANI